MFNKYKFIKDLKKEVNNLDEDIDVQEYIHQELNKAVIGQPKNISQKLYNTLYDFVYNELEL
jgi:ribosomal protein S3